MPDTQASLSESERLPGWLTVVLVFLVTTLTACSGDRPRENVLAPQPGETATLMAFDWPLNLQSLPPGWSHATFKRHDPMKVTFVRKDGRVAARLATADTASMLFRQVDVHIDEFPWLSWEWMIEQSIEGDYDETTAAGDDHAARIYLTFEDDEGQRKSAQLVWGGPQLQPGDWKHLSYLKGLIGPYSHYAVNGGRENVGRWHQERVDLRVIYRQAAGSREGVRLVEIALFADTDETGATSVAYIGPIKVAPL